MRTTINFSKPVLLVVSMLSMTNIYSQLCPSGLISYWKMDETSGLTLFDDAGSHNATCNTELAVDESAKVGTSHFFYSDTTDSGNKAVIAGNSDFDFPAHSGFSIVYWIKCTDVNYSGLDHVVISRGDYRNGHPVGTFWSSGIDIYGKINFLLQDSAGNRKDLESPLAYNDGNWHQIAFVRNDSAEINYLYVDGNIVVQENFAYTGSFSSPEDIQVSNLKNTVSGTLNYGYFFRGSIDEMAIYNRPLTSIEINNQVLAANSGVGICYGLNPTIMSVPWLTADVGSPYSYIVHAIGLETGMSYTLLTHPEGMTIDSTSGVISWTPASILADGLVSVVAENGNAPADTQTFRINIAEATGCPDGLFLLLKLDETSGPVYSDYFGVHNVEAVVPPMPEAGIVNGAQLFDTTTTMDIPDISSEFDFPAGSSFSYEYWIRTSLQKTMVCLGRHRLDTEKTAFMYVGTNIDGKAAFELRDNGGTLKMTTGTTVITDGNWHHFVAVRDGVAGLDNIYVDGIMEASDSVKFDSSFAAVVPTEINIGYLHRLKTDEPYYHFAGSLDEIAIYNRAVTAAEARRFYNNGHPTDRCSARNFAPVITSVPVTTAVENKVYSYSFITDDPDQDDVLVLSAIEKPSWLSFNWSAGQKAAILEGTPSHTDIGDYPLILRVSDGRVQKDQSFIISVTRDNDIPVITSSPLLSATVNVLYTYHFTATEAVDTVLKKSAVLLPAWMQFDSLNGVLSGIPMPADTGNNEVILRVSDGRYNVDQDFTVVVTGTPVMLNEAEISGIHVFPVPARDVLNLTFDYPFKEMWIEVINSSGKIIAIKELPAYTEKYSLDVSGSENGIYFLNIHNDSLSVKAVFMIIK